MAVYKTPNEEIRLIEYKVRKVERFMVTRYERGKQHVSASVVIGEYPSWDTAYTVAYALADQERQMRGFLLDDERIQFPEPSENEGALVEIDLDEELAKI